MIAAGVFVGVLLLLWAGTMWALHWGFKRQAQHDRARGLDPTPAPRVDADHAQFWQARSGVVSGRVTARGSR